MNSRPEGRNKMEKYHGCTETQKVKEQETHAARFPQDGAAGDQLVPELRAGEAAARDMSLVRILQGQAGHFSSDGVFHARCC